MFNKNKKELKEKQELYKKIDRYYAEKLLDEIRPIICVQGLDINSEINDLRFKISVKRKKQNLYKTIIDISIEMCCEVYTHRLEILEKDINEICRQISRELAIDEKEIGETND